MRNLLLSLNKICQDHLLATKVLVMPSHSGGYKLLQAYTEKGYFSINLRTTTILALAQELCRPYLYQKDLKLIDQSLLIHLVQGILERLKEAQGLKYFNHLEVTPGISRAIAQGLMELKMAGLTGVSLDENAFISPDKGQDMKRIFVQYEGVLKSQGLIDTADLYNLALRISKDIDGQTLYIIPDNLRLLPLEKRFLDSLTKGKVKTLSLAEADLLNTLPPYWKEKPQLFQAFGEANEVTEVIRRIKRDNIPLDQVTIYYSTLEPYSQHLYNLAQKDHLPLTFGEGINIKNSRPGRMFFQLLEWARKDYDVLTLAGLITGGIFTLDGGEGPSNARIARMLRRAGIGWGKDRYISQLTKAINDLEEKINNAEDETSRASYGKILQEYRWLQEFIANVLALFPEPDQQGLYSYGNWVTGISKFIGDYGLVLGGIDGEAKKAIVATLEGIAAYGGESRSLEDILKGLESMVESIRIGRSTAKPGHIHVDSYKRGIWVNRSYTFVVGLDSSRFPGQSKEDPIILDVERQRLSSGLPLTAHKPKEKVQDLSQLLVSREGTVTLSYSAFDTVENREVSPAHIMLQVYRLAEGDNSKDYSQLINYLGHKASYIPRNCQEAHDRTQYWLNQNFFGLGIKDHRELLLKAFKHFNQGLTAWEARLTTLFTPYDGKVIVHSDHIDPRRNRQIIMSASQLEQLAKCPYGYFLRYILNVRAPEDISYDPGVWLDAATRGTVLHTIFERFYGELKRLKATPSLLSHGDLIESIAWAALEEIKEDIPPPSELIFEYECRDILESCRVFLVGEEKEAKGLTPSHFELAFGPVPIALPTGEEIMVKGKIDRIDQDGDNNFLVLDYKTGSTYNFKANNHYQRGKQLQHTLYSIAFEEELKNSGDGGKVAYGGYIFPTVKGEGQRFLRSQEDRQPFYEIIENLCQILATGAFVMTDDSGDCRFCDYLIICTQPNSKEKLADGANVDLEPFRRLKTYE